MDKPENVDRNLLYAAATTIGVPRLADLLIVFDRRITSLATALIALPHDQPGVIAKLHQSRGSAATLGFVELERVLADIETRLTQEIDNTADNRPAVLSPEAGSQPPLHPLVDAVGRSWQAALAAALSIVPELQHHRPCGINK